MSRYSPKRGRFASAKAFASNKANAAGENIKTTWPDDKPLDLDCPHALAELQRDASVYAGHWPEPCDVPIARTWRQLLPLFDGFAYDRRYRKGTMWIAPGEAAVSVRACVRLAERSWPGCTVLLLKAEDGSRCVRRIDGKWITYGPEHANFLV
jgi:hypothetical protein